MVVMEREFLEAAVTLLGTDRATWTDTRSIRRLGDMHKVCQIHSPGKLPFWYVHKWVGR